MQDSPSRNFRRQRFLALIGIFALAGAGLWYGLARQGLSGQASSTSMPQVEPAAQAGTVAALPNPPRDAALEQMREQVRTRVDEIRTAQEQLRKGANPEDVVPPSLPQRTGR